MTERSEYFSRVAGRVDLEALADRLVVIVGIGWVGSALALELGARCGVGHLALVDGDRLEPSNLPRHVLPRSYLWVNKAEGVADYLSSVPGLDVGALNRYIDESFTNRELDRLLAPADLIVVATDSRAVQRRVAERALALDIPAVIPGLYADRGGEVFVQLGPGHPCFRCWDNFRPAEAEVRGVTALSADSLAVIQEAAYLSLGVLDTHANEARDLAPAPGDHRPRQLFVVRPAMNLMRVPMNRRPGCPSCAVGPSTVRTGRARPRHGAGSRVTEFLTSSARPTAADWSFVLSHTAAPPQVDLVSVSDAVVLEGTVVTLSWATSNATHVEIDGAGPFPTIGELELTVTETAVFRVDAVNPFGRASAVSTPVRAFALPQLPAVHLPAFSTLEPHHAAELPRAPEHAVSTSGHLAWPLFEYPPCRFPWTGQAGGPPDWPTTHSFPPPFVREPTDGMAPTGRTKPTSYISRRRRAKGAQG